MGRRSSGGRQLAGRDPCRWKQRRNVSGVSCGQRDQPGRDRGSRAKDQCRADRRRGDARRLRSDSTARRRIPLCRGTVARFQRCAAGSPTLGLSGRPARHPIAAGIGTRKRLRAGASLLRRKLPIHRDRSGADHVVPQLRIATPDIGGVGPRIMAGSQLSVSITNVLDKALESSIAVYDDAAHVVASDTSRVSFTAPAWRAFESRPPPPTGWAMALQPTRRSR